MDEGGFFSRFAREASITVGMGLGAIIFINIDREFDDWVLYAGIAAGGALGWLVQLLIRRALAKS